MKRTMLVVGARGSIGQVVCRRLIKEGYYVLPLVRREGSPFLDEHMLHHLFADVRNLMDLQQAADRINDESSNIELAGVVYCVGLCPPGGFSEAIRHPLATLPTDTLLEEFGVHQLGVLNTFQAFSRRVTAGGSLTFISSAITRIDDFPKGMYPWHHVAMVAAQDVLIKGMRQDPIVEQLNLRINRIAPPAVDTPFHEGGSRPPRMVSIEEVAEEVVRAIGVIGSDHVDKVMVPNLTGGT